MTNSVQEVLTNTVSVSTVVHNTPQAVAYNFKEWMAVIWLVYASIHTFLSHVLPPIINTIKIFFCWVVDSGGYRPILAKFKGPKQP